MAARAPIIMKRLAGSTYETSSDNTFQFPPVSNAELSTEDVWSGIDIGTQFRLAASGTIVNTANIGRSAPDVTQAAMAGLDAILDAIANTRVLPHAGQLDDLLTQATLRHGRPENLEAWARQLADSVRDLID